ncbi:TPR repeat protein [Undibacterium sp. GrIS 1.8]|uniref:tetratricopeptide repeat protein n=1 Tax=Undibacterium sp. GrIS 1.8 TaxID=3143934 RepID=UPI003396E70A
MTKTTRTFLFLLALLIPSMALPHACLPRPDIKDINKLKTAAQGGDFASMTTLGWYYELGFGVEQDYTQSSFWYKLAADNGNVFSQRKIAINYELGQGVSYDHKEAIRYYKISQSAQKEDLYSGSTILMLFQNSKKHHDFSTAFEWLELCAESNMQKCQFELARNYRYQGGVVDVNYSKAMNWFIRSMQSGMAVESIRQEP